LVMTSNTGGPPAKTGIKLVLKRSSEEQQWTVQSPPIRTVTDEQESDSEQYEQEYDEDELQDEEELDNAAAEDNQLSPAEPSEKAPRKIILKTSSGTIRTAYTHTADASPQQSRKRKADPATTEEEEISLGTNANSNTAPAKPKANHPRQPISGNASLGNKILIKKPPVASKPLSITIKRQNTTGSVTDTKHEDPAIPPIKKAKTTLPTQPKGPKPPLSKLPPAPSASPPVTSSPAPPGARQPPPRRAVAAKPSDEEKKVGQYYPLNTILEKILDELEEGDHRQIFHLPVDPVEVPDYYTVIKRPMDFATMRKNLTEGKYTTMALFESDFELICDNATTYNAPRTVFFKEAKRLLQHGKKFIKKQIPNIDPSLVGTPPPKPPPQKPPIHATSPPISSPKPSNTTPAAAAAARAAKKRTPQITSPPLPSNTALTQTANTTPLTSDAQKKVFTDPAGRAYTVPQQIPPAGAYSYSMFMQKNNQIGNPPNSASSVIPGSVQQPPNSQFGYVTPATSNTGVYNNYASNYLYFGNQPKNPPGTQVMIQQTGSHTNQEQLTGRVPLDELTKSMSPPSVNAVNSLMANLKKPQQGAQHLAQPQQQAIWISVDLLTQINAADAVTPVSIADFKLLLSLQSEGFDVEFLRNLHTSLSGANILPTKAQQGTAGKGQIQDILDKNYEGLYSLQLSQLERGAQPPAEQEHKLASRLTENLGTLASQVPPKALISTHTAQKALTLAHLQTLENAANQPKT
jgi:hypothetical protein